MGKTLESLISTRMNHFQRWRSCPRSSWRRRYQRIYISSCEPWVSEPLSLLHVTTLRTSYIFVGLDHVTSGLQLSAMETNDIQPCITIEAVIRGQFGTVDALARNHIAKLEGDQPDSLLSFRERLRQIRWIANDTVKLFFIHLPLQVLIVVSGS